MLAICRLGIRWSDAQSPAHEMKIVHSYLEMARQAIASNLRFI